MYDFCKGCKSVLEHLFYPLHVSSVLFDTHLSFTCSSCNMPSDTFVQVVGVIDCWHWQSWSWFLFVDCLHVYFDACPEPDVQWCRAAQTRCLCSLEWLILLTFCYFWKYSSHFNSSFPPLGLEVAQSSLLLGGRRSAYFWRGKEVLWEQWSCPCYHYQSVHTASYSLTVI